MKQTAEAPDPDPTFTDSIGELENAGHNNIDAVHDYSSQQEKYQNKEECSAVTANDAPSTLLTLDAIEDPQQWPRGKKWVCTIINVVMTATIAFCPSIYTAAITDIYTDFDISRTVATLGVTTFLLGFAVGPLLFAPLSEVWGRRTVFLATMPMFVVGNVACAVAPDIAVMLVFRFVCGVFGSPSVTNSGGCLTDMWPQSQRSVPFALFSAASFLGPVISPVIGGFLSEYASWRWNFGLLAILGAVDYLLLIFFLPETYKPKLLLRKAERLYKDNKELSPAELPVHLRPKKIKYSAILTRPWIMLCTEPILFLLSLYMAFVFGLLYLDFTAYPLVFTLERGWTPAESGLSFLGIGVGMGIATACSPLLDTLHARLAARELRRSESGSNNSHNHHPKPEARLPHLILLSWLIPAALFWFAWTAEPPTPWIASILSGIPFGVGALALFLGITAYLTDCYGHTYAASALAANAVLRSLFGAVFPLFSRRLYTALGTPWATSLLGFVAVALAPLPAVFYVWGPWLRARSRFHVGAVRAEEESGERGSGGRREGVVEEGERGEC